MVGKIVTGLVKLPFAVAADAVTMGGLLTDRKETHTGSVLDQIVDGIDEDK